MRLTIDVSKDSSFFQFDGHTIGLENIPVDRQGEINDLREKLEDAKAKLETYPRAGVSPAVASEILQEILAGRISREHKINCLKMIRTLTDIDLKGAVDLVNDVFSRRPF